MTLRITGTSRLVPIIGDPIIYARSPDWLSQTFADRGRPEICVPMQVPAQALQSVLTGLSAVPNVVGLLVTMPHKHAIFSLCASVSERSRLLQAVSVMRRNQEGGWHGDMLEGNAFVQAQIEQGAQPRGARALLLGTGGAGSAIAIALLEAGVAELLVYDIDTARSAQLAGALNGLGLGRVRVGTPDPTGCDMVCNATPLGMADGDPLPLDTGLLCPSMFVGDVIAGHGETRWLRDARAAGCKTADGDQMVKAVLGSTVDFLAALS